MMIKPEMVLGRYRIRSSIGSGGMGEVYLADDVELGRPAALKVLVDNIGDIDSIKRFLQEAKAASALNHPNIITVYEIGAFEDSRFIATEFIAGRTLRSRMLEGGLTGRESLDIVGQIAAALDAAHEAGIVHRDVKPENVMLRSDGLVKVLDFGLAKLADDKPGLVDPEEVTLARVKTIPGMVLGTVNYMSPEQARGREVDARSDIWSLGVVFYEMLAGRTPFAEETATDTMAAILKSEPAPLPAETPAEVSRIIRKALQKDRGERYQTVKDFLLDVKELKRELEFASEVERSNMSAPRLASSRFLHAAAPSGATRPLSAIEHTQQDERQSFLQTGVAGTSGRRRIWPAAAAAILLLGAVGAAAYLFISRASAGQINSIAVLPFAGGAVAAPSDATGLNLTDSISEALINNLSKLPQLKVISRSSSFKYRQPDPDISQIAAALGVQAVVTGRITRSGDDLQVGVEVVKASDASLIWGETYNRRISDLQAIQEDIARNISQKLQLDLSGEQQQRIARRATTNPQAYELYLSGVFYARKRGIDNIRTALAYQKQAIALDPNFALAYVEMAANYTAMVGSDVIDPAEGKGKAREAVEKALELDNTLAEAHLALARIKNDDLDLNGAGESFRRAIELNPNLASTRRIYAFYLSCIGRYTEALDEIRRAQELDPLNAGLQSTEGSIFYLAGRYDEAVQKLQESVSRDGNDTFAIAYLGLAYTASGRYADALEQFRKVEQIQGETTSNSIFIARALIRAGRRDEALAISDKLERTKQYVSPGEMATLYAALGETEKALAALDKAYAARDLQLQFLRSDPGYDPLRSEPRFIELSQRIGLPA